MKNVIDHDETSKLRDLFVGKSVRKVADDRLELSDGTRLRLEGNEGCGGCPAGFYTLTKLNECENIITNVVVEMEEEDDSIEPDCTYRLFVISGEDKVNLATFEGTDGNGYYGTGFWIEVMAPE